MTPRQYLINFRIKIVRRIFPVNRQRICANRREVAFETDRAEVRLIFRNKEKPDGYSYEEMLHFMDVFFGRKTTTEEWRQMLMWKMKK